MSRVVKKRVLWAAGVGLVLLGGFGAVSAMRPNRAIDPAKLVAVERGDIARSVVATGKIEPLAKVEVKSKANGIIKELKVDIGDTVRAGQVLAELDRDNLAARLREAQAALTGAQANLKAAEAELAKNQVEAEGPQAAFMASDSFERRFRKVIRVIDDPKLHIEDIKIEERAA